jgi:glycosyltransferase involved in cell wall biosynthesis
MGAWLDRVATTSSDGWRQRRVVFLGHLVPRQGVGTLLEALALLVDRGEEVTAEIVGTGPLEDGLREYAKRLGLDTVVDFRGFVRDHRDVERALAGSSIAVAPYSPGEETFTQYADPGKLKAYLAAGLPIVLTDVPPNAAELSREAGADVVEFDASAIADAISRGLASSEAWANRRRSALAYVRRFDWAELLPDLLEKLDLAGGQSRRSTRPLKNPYT